MPYVIYESIDKRTNKISFYLLTYARVKLFPYILGLGGFFRVFRVFFLKNLRYLIYLKKLYLRWNIPYVNIRLISGQKLVQKSHTELVGVNVQEGYFIFKKPQKVPDLLTL